MHITPKMLSIPPYLSTTWKNISSLHVQEEEKGALILIVTLQNRVQIEVPGLDQESLDQIFHAHTKFADQDLPIFKPFEPDHFSFNIPIKSDGSLDLIQSSLQHNADQSDMAPLPADLLKRVATIAQAFGLEDTAVLPQPEPNCNCAFCQVVRSLHGQEEILPIEEKISAEDLKFKDWEVVQKGDKLYFVTNPLDKNEHYNVFLGEPLGCTCGKKSCEHIRAVLTT